MIITETEYLAAKKIVDDYEIEQEKLARIREKNEKAKQEIRERDCTEHYFIESTAKWTNFRECQFCGKRI